MKQQLRALGIVVVGALIALIGVHGSASAAPIAYPASVCSTISVSTTNPSLGQAITVTGQAFEPGASVSLELSAVSGGSAVLTKTVTASSSGAFSTSLTMPDSTADKGRYDIVATSGYTTGGSCPADPSVEVSVGLAGTGGAAGSASPSGTSSGTGSSSGSSSGSGTTAVTGLDVAMLIVVAVALVGAGGLLVARGRRAHS